MDPLANPMILFAVVAALIFVVGRLLNQGAVSALHAGRISPKLPPAGRHELVIADPVNDFPDSDTEFYNRGGQELAKSGFNWVGYFEDRTLTRMRPRARSFYSAFVNGDGTVMAILHEARAGGSVPSQYLTELYTEFNNGEFLVSCLTTAVNAGIVSRPGLTAQVFPAETPLRRALYEHDAAAGKMLHAGDSVTERPARTLPDIIEARQRFWSILDGTVRPGAAAPALWPNS